MKMLTFIPLIFALILVSCGGKEKDKKVENTTPNVPTIKTGLKIAYYYQDSLKEGFDYYREMDSLTKAKQIRFQSTLEGKQRSLQQYLVDNDNKAKTGELSAFQIQAIQQEAQRREQALYQYQQTEGAKLEQETVELLEVITRKIEAVGKRYCKEHHIDMLLIHGPGGQINYIDGSMDVTKEFIAYLNQNEDEIEEDMGIDKKKTKK